MKKSSCSKKWKIICTLLIIAIWAFYGFAFWLFMQVAERIYWEIVIATALMPIYITANIIVIMMGGDIPDLTGADRL